MDRKRALSVRCLAMFAAFGWIGAHGLPNRSNSEENAKREDWLLNPSPYAAKLQREERPGELVLTNGLVARRFRLEPNGATVAFDNLMTDASLLRGVQPEAALQLNGETVRVGGLQGQPNYGYLLPEWEERLEAGEKDMVLKSWKQGIPQARLHWKRVRHHAPDSPWPPKGVSLEMVYRMPEGKAPKDCDGIEVSVHYELYDGMPCLCKWITVRNRGESPVMLDRFTSEILSVVEYGSAVEDRGLPFHPPNLHVETDYAMGGMTAAQANRFSVHWVPDPLYHSQVNYAKKNPCLLEARPSIGPSQLLGPGASFESFRTFLLARDSYDRERNGLAQRRMYRTVAPWVTENPLMMHVRYADPETVKRAVDQCAEVGFEMVILTFGSGFDAEDDRPETLDRMKAYAQYAEQRGVEIGGYSLLASRKVGGGDDVVMPEGQSPAFGQSPCLCSAWGRDYFDKLYRFFRETGFDLLEHDGSYPGDVCASQAHPGHRGLGDSRWNQWSVLTEFYAWLRERGVYLNVPDYYYLAGSNKSGMGYREVNWSLPREQQVIHTRQNIYDGTWQKTPSMGWMFVPLTEYHGGGAEATIEPLSGHLDHYERMLYSNLAFGVQACYRGPRLYDTDKTREMVKGWVDWFKRFRDILESDLVHGRRADGRDLDWMVHVNPGIEDKAMLVAFNPTRNSVRKSLAIPLYYAGLSDKTAILTREGKESVLPLHRDYTADVTIDLEPGGMTWVVFRERR